MGYWGYRRYWEHFPRSVPRQAKGGIKAQSRRGGFGESWWAKRWISVLESFDIGARLGRGRNYARRGQVLEIKVEKGSVAASVQGSRPSPYRIKIEMKALSQEQWKKLAQDFSSQAIFAAKLLSGQMPENIEDAFKHAGCSLFPQTHSDLKTECSCPDWSNPCKHIAAVYYILGEEFDRDPFLIFKLRGKTREELMEVMGGDGGAAAQPQKKRGRKGGAKQRDAEKPIETPVAAVSTDPLPSDPSAYWGKDDATAGLLGDVRIPSLSAALPKRLGSFPLWRAEENFIEVMERIYAAASQQGFGVMLGEKVAIGPENRQNP